MSYVPTAAMLVGRDLLSALLVAVCVLGPGWLFAWGLAKRLGWTLDAVAPAALAVTTALAGTAALVGHPLDLSLDAALAVFVALAVVAGAAGRLIGRGAERPAVEKEALVLGGSVAALAVIVGPYMGLTADTFYHLAGANSLLARNAVAVTDPMYRTSVTALDPTSGAWHTLLALVSRVTTLGPDLLWGGLTAVVAACLVLAFRSLLRAATGSARAATLATVAWVLFTLYADFRPAAYPKMGSLAIVFITLCAVLELVARPSWPAAVFAVIGGLAVSTAHLGSAQLLYLGVAAIWVWMVVDLVVAKVRREPLGWRSFRAASGTAGATALVAAACVLPRLASLGGGAGLVDAARTDIEGSLIRLPFGIVTAKPGAFVGGGPALSVALIALVLLMAWSVLGPARQRKAFGALAVASLPLLTIYNPIVATILAGTSPYVFARVGALLAFAPYVALAWALAQADGRGWLERAPRWLGYGTVVAALVGGAVPLAGTFVTLRERRGNRFPVYVTRLIDMRVEWGAGLQRLRDTVSGDYPVLAGDPETTYYAAGLVRTAIVAAPPSHSPYVIERGTGAARRADMAVLLRPGTSIEGRRALLQAWRADYVLLWVTKRPVEAAAYAEMAAQTGLFAEVFGPEGNGGLALLRVKR